MKTTAPVFLAAIALLAPNAWAHDYDQPAESSMEIHPLVIGSELPELKIRDGDGKVFDLNAAISEKPTVLIFYRGGW